MLALLWAHRILHVSRIMVKYQVHLSNVWAFRITLSLLYVQFLEERRVCAVKDHKQKWKLIPTKRDNIFDLQSYRSITFLRTEKYFPACNEGIWNMGTFNQYYTWFKSFLSTNFIITNNNKNQSISNSRIFPSSEVLVSPVFPQST